MLCVLTFREKEFCRPFETFIPRSARLVIHFDSCLTGLGIILFEKGEAADGSDDVWMGGCAASLRRYNINKGSSFQNTCEFVGAIVGLVVAIRYERNM